MGHTKLKVDLPGRPRPKLLFGHRPDLTSMAPNGRGLILEVEPSGSSLSSHAVKQLRAFRRYAKPRRARLLLFRYRKSRLGQALP
jgi:hypothetical protein